MVILIDISHVAILDLVFLAVYERMLNFMVFWHMAPAQILLMETEGVTLVHTSVGTTEVTF